MELALRTSEEFDVGWFVGESIFLALFLTELLLRFSANEWSISKTWQENNWNKFDVVIVGAGALDSWILAFLEIKAMTLLPLLRIFRVLRLLRLFRFLRKLLLLAQGIWGAVKALVWAVLSLCLLIGQFRIK